MKMKTTISIPDALFKAAERLAKRLGIPRSRLYSRAIERYVSEAERPDVTALLNKIYQNESSELDPVLEALQSVATPREQW
jgi:metal-responsive CopG/Arc/MetJ family transcriptional regulator